MGADLTGKIIDGRYRIVSPLGAGGVGAVYRAEQSGGGPLVALKMLHDEYGTDPESRERFQREARALNGLQHANIVGVVDFGITDSGPYLVMDLLDGMPLDSFLETQKPSVETILDLGRQVLTGLAFAHAQGVIHRDMKTENVFVARLANGQLVAKILDFGLAKFVDDDRWGASQKLTVMGAVMGTPAYMSPEQGTGQRLDARSDVYSTGVILYEMFTGEWPYMEEDRVQMLRMHLMGTVPSIAEKVPGLSVRPELQALVVKAMGKMPNDRYANGAEMLAAFDAIPRPAAWRESQTPTYVPPAPVTPIAPPGPQSSSKMPLILGVAAVGIVALLALGGIVVYLVLH